MKTQQTTTEAATVMLDLDLTAQELMALYALAVLGCANMTQNDTLIAFAEFNILERDVTPKTAQSALTKMRGALAMLPLAMDSTTTNTPETLA